jgi:UDP-N-acetylmuramate--alanine ligase
VARENGSHVHFIGIGGIGMSGIAEVLLTLGFTVSGSDLERSAITERLASLGASVWRGHDARHVEGSDIVVVSSAIKPGNVELEAAQQLGIPVIARTKMLAELMRIRTGIAIAGAHGKTTTTSLAAVVLDEAGLDPTVVVGGKVKSMKTNARLGEGTYIVAEADESDGNFVQLTPLYALITNIDEEHLDFYGGLEAIYDSFVRFARQVPFNGAVICCADDPHLRTIIPRIDRRIVLYGFGDDADVRGSAHGAKSGGSSFTLTVRGERRGELFLPLPGAHNVSNALGVCALAEELGIPFDVVARALAAFEGVGRRFEVKGEAGGVLFVDDYGHHPTEVRAVIRAARETFDRRLVVVFQPHRYTRTRDIGDLFEDSFADADEVFITDIYPAGERPIPGVDGELVYRAVRRGGHARVSYLADRASLRSAVEENIRPGDLVLTLGAGDIWKLGEELLEKKGSGGT